MNLRAVIACVVAACMLCVLGACGTKGPLYLPKKEPAPAAKPLPPVPPAEPVPETTNKPGQ